MRFSISVVVASLAWLVFSQIDTSNQQTPHVQTSSGVVIGHHAPNASSVWEFLGIRYAQPPTGNLRFAAPQPVNNSLATVNASNWAPDCPANLAPPSTFPNFTGNGQEIFSTFTGHTGNPQAEDCLAVNVWTRSTSTLAKRPVLMFMHGGRFSIPGPHNVFYFGQYLAEAEDVVIVTISYRLGIFGFSGAPNVEQNVGLLDQRLAVEWVSENIVGFGGDPSRITLMGQSAGAASADYYAYTYVDDPLIAGIISHSGTALSFIPNDPSYSLSSFYNVSGTLGCGGPSDDPVTVVACVRAANFTAVLAAAKLPPPLPSAVIAQPVFHPTVDNQTVFTYQTYLDRSASGQFAKVPFFTGNNANEDGTYRINAFAAGVTLNDSQWQAFDDAAFVCPSSTEAKNRAANGVPTWRWVYHGDWDNLRLYPNSGTYHGSEMTLLFNTTYELIGQADSPAEAEVGEMFMKAWAAFAANPSTGLSSFGWPQYDPNASTLIQIALNDSTTTTFANPSAVDSGCPPVNNPQPGMGAF